MNKEITSRLFFIEFIPWYFTDIILENSIWSFIIPLFCSIMISYIGWSRKNTVFDRIIIIFNISLIIQLLQTIKYRFEMPELVLWLVLLSFLALRIVSTYEARLNIMRLIKKIK
jgi:hypothetical protein